MDLLEVRFKDVNWIQLAQYNIQWRECERSMSSEFLKTKELADQFSMYQLFK
jgi:hypothetical protein